MNDEDNFQKFSGDGAVDEEEGAELGKEDDDFDDQDPKDDGTDDDDELVPTMDDKDAF